MPKEIHRPRQAVCCIVGVHQARAIGMSNTGAIPRRVVAAARDAIACRSPARREILPFQKDSENRLPKLRQINRRIQAVTKGVGSETDASGTLTEVEAMVAIIYAIALKPLGGPSQTSKEETLPPGRYPASALRTRRLLQSRFGFVFYAASSFGSTCTPVNDSSSNPLVLKLC